MVTPLAAIQPGTTKRLDSEYYVEGYATTFNQPYLLYEYDGIQFFEQVDSRALDEADLTDVIFQYDHHGTVFARNQMAKNKPTSLIIEPQASGLFVAADLGVIEEAKRLYEAIDAGLVHKMSWAYRVTEDSYDTETRTRTILKISKVYDVSAVSIPMNENTDISARSWPSDILAHLDVLAASRKYCVPHCTCAQCEEGSRYCSSASGVIETEMREALARRLQLLKLQIELEDLS